MQTTTVTSKTGTEFELNVQGASVIARAKGTDLGGVVLTETGIKTRFPRIMGGRSVHIEAAFGGEALTKVQAMFARVREDAEGRDRENCEYDRRHNQVIRGMNGDN